jgi:chaperone modulatory protein CbpM
MRLHEFQLQTSIGFDALTAWIEAGWLRPTTETAPRDLSEMELFEADRARAQLILDLQSVGVNDEAIPIILDLIDQLHGLRRRLRLLASTAAREGETAAISLRGSPADREL